MDRVERCRPHSRPAMVGHPKTDSDPWAVIQSATHPPGGHGPDRTYSTPDRGTGPDRPRRRARPAGFGVISSGLTARFRPPEMRTGYCGLSRPAELGAQAGSSSAMTPAVFPRRSGRSFSGCRRSFMARPVDADPILRLSRRNPCIWKARHGPRIHGGGRWPRLQYNRRSPLGCGACPRPAGSKTVRVIFKRYGCRRAVAADSAISVFAEKLAPRSAELAEASPANAKMASARHAHARIVVLLIPGFRTRMGRARAAS